MVNNVITKKAIFLHYLHQYPIYINHMVIVLNLVVSTALFIVYLVQCQGNNWLALLANTFFTKKQFLQDKDQAYHLKVKC